MVYSKIIYQSEETFNIDNRKIIGILMDSPFYFNFSIKERKLPIIGKLDALMLGNTGSLALPAEYAGVGIMDHDPAGNAFIDDVLVRYGVYRADLLTGIAAYAFISIKLRLAPEVGVGHVHHFGKLGRVRPFYQGLNRFYELSEFW